MICYRDMTFCPFYKDCRDKDDCHRPLTEAVKQQAAHWWGKNEEAPIMQFSDIPDCHRPQDDNSPKTRSSDPDDPKKPR